MGCALSILRPTGFAAAVVLAVVGSASPAVAEPISLVFALFSSSFLAGATTIAGLSVGQFILATVGVVASGLNALLAGKQKVNPGDYKNTFETAESSEINAIGRVRLGGLRVFGNTKLYDRYRLIWHCKGPLVTIERTFLGGREVTTDETGLVTTPPYAKSDGGSWVQILSKVGDGTETAWTQLVTAFPQLWTSSHTAKGIFQSLVKYVSPGIYSEKFGKLYSKGEGDLEHVARVLTSYDPRDPSQSATNRATWTWTDNGPLCAARVMCDYPDLTAASFDWAFIGAEATKADVLVATKTGTEPRSRCSGIWLSEARRGDTMQDLLDSIGCEIVVSPDDLIRIRLIDDVPTPELLLEAQHQSEFIWKSGPDAVERPNVCVVKYYSPERNYELAEIDMTGIAWARIDSEVARYGEKQFLVDLPFCISASQAQRIARRLFALERADSGKVLMNWTGLKAWGAMYATIEDDTAEESHLCRIAPPRIDDAAGQVDIPYAAWPTLTPWNPATDEAAAPEQVPDFQSETDLDKPATPVEATVVQYPGGGYETRMKAATVTGASTNPARTNAVMRTYSGALPNAFSRMTAYFGLGTTVYAYKAVDGRTRGDFKIQFFTDAEEASYFSDILAVNPLAIDNTPCGAPLLLVTLNGEEPPYTMTGSVRVSQLRAARILVEIKQDSSSTWTTLLDDNARPEVTYSFNPGGSFVSGQMVRATVFTSDGTPGTPATYSF